jgi:hypothetical protein
MALRYTLDLDLSGELTGRCRLRPLDLLKTHTQRQLIDLARWLQGDKLVATHIQILLCRNKHQKEFLRYARTAELARAQAPETAQVGKRAKQLHHGLRVIAPMGA